MLKFKILHSVIFINRQILLLVILFIVLYTLKMALKPHFQSLFNF